MIEKLEKIFEPRHIDNCGHCCLQSWAQHTMSIIGWEPSPQSEDFCPIALVCVCKECGESWWTHYDWIPLGEEYLSNEAIELLKARK